MKRLRRYLDEKEPPLKSLAKVVRSLEEPAETTLPDGSRNSRRAWTSVPTEVAEPLLDEKEPTLKEFARVVRSR